MVLLKLVDAEVVLIVCVSDVAVRLPLVLDVLLVEPKIASDVCELMPFRVEYGGRMCWV